MGFFRWVFLGFFGWVFLGGFFNANPATHTGTGNVSIVPGIACIWYGTVRTGTDSLRYGLYKIGIPSHASTGSFHIKNIS